MKPEDALLYLCCTQRLAPERLERVATLARAPGLDWPEVYALAYRHGVAPLIYHNLVTAQAAGVTVPHATLQQLKLAAYGNLLAKQEQRQRLLRALDFLHANGLRAMAVKGFALDLLVYDQAWYTMAADVDLVLRPADPQGPHAGLRQVERGLGDLGIRGIEFEFYRHHDVDLNETLPVDFDAIWSATTPYDLEGRTIYLMQPEDMLLAVCVNSCRKRYFRLRSLCDIAETIRRFPALDWRVFVQKAIAYECDNIVYAALAVTQTALGCTLPDGLLCELGVGFSRRRFVDLAARRLLRHLSLAALSYYEGPEAVGRKMGWSLVLPYVTYRWGQMRRKLLEALTAYSFPVVRQV